MKISLCMIVKDEEKYIEMCLQNALPLVDEVIIIDTGSTDKTIEIINKLSSSKIQVYNYKWNNNFSDARNASLIKATGDWILVLDADEKVIFNKEELIKEIKETNHLAYNIPIYNFVDKKTVLYSNVMIRLYKNLNPQYTGEIHEQITLDNKSLLCEDTLDESIVKIFHYGYLVTTFKEKDKLKRNIDIIKSQLKKEPKVPFHWYNLGIMYMNEQKADKALDAFIKCHELTGKIRYTFHVDIVLRMAECMVFLGENKKCRTFLEIALKDEVINKRTDAHYCLGLAYKGLKKYNEANKSFNRCIELGESKEGIAIQGRGSYLPKIAIAEILVEENQIAQGVMKYLEAVFDSNNYSKTGLEHLRNLLIKHKMNDILIELERTLESSHDKIEIKSRIKECINSNSLDKAKQLINNYEKLEANDPDVWCMKSIVFMIGNDLDSAKSIIEEGLIISPHHPDLLYNKAYLYQITEKYQEALHFYKKALEMTTDTKARKDIEDAINDLE